MRILVVGAGAIGGYFGGRLLAAGRDVTFLVRAARAARLAADGLRVRSGFGDLHLPAPPTVQAGGLGAPYDLVLLSCKTYDLDGALDAFTPAVGPATLVLPMLNGMAHFETLDRRFGAGRVLGGLCLISSVMDPEGRIVHRNRMHGMVFGDRGGVGGARLEAVEAALAGAGFDARRSTEIVQELWEKWVFIAATAGVTCLMRATVGDVVAAAGTGFVAALLEECAAAAARQGFPPRAAALERMRAILTEPGSAVAASMLDDLERGRPTEAEPIIGDLVRRGRARGAALPLLALAHTHLRTFEARRERMAAAAGTAPA
ncbi:MAG: 2-dehydropantoate 2-reductase [Holophaga sp.]|jgi:2-dehydropantoate 2-reductase